MIFIAWLAMLGATGFGIYFWYQSVQAAKRKKTSRLAAHILGYVILASLMLGPSRLIEGSSAWWWVFFAAVSAFAYLLFSPNLKGKKLPTLRSNDVTNGEMPQREEQLLKAIELIQTDAAQRESYLEDQLIAARKEIEILSKPRQEAEAIAKQIVELQGQFEELKIGKSTAIEQGMTQLIEICEALTADQKLTNEEVNYLQTWLQRHPQVLELASGQAVSNKIRVILADGKITPRERSDLLEMLLAIASGEWRDDGELERFPQLKPLSPTVATLASTHKAKSASTKTQYIDEIEFDYIDAKGDHTSRRVLVREIAYDRVKGQCTARRMPREFLFDRMIGKITSRQTGLIADPQSWINSIQ